MRFLTLRRSVGSSLLLFVAGCGEVKPEQVDAGETVDAALDASVDAPVGPGNPPVNALTAGTVMENATLSLSGLLVSADPDTQATGLVYTVRSIPVDGQLKLDTTVLAIGSTFTQQDVTDGKLSYTQNGAENPADAFTWSLSDGSNTIPATGATTFAITVTAVNDAPLIVNNPVTTVAEGGMEVLTTARLMSSDAEGASTLTYTFTAVTHGVLQKRTSGVFATLAIGGTFTQADIAAGDVRFVDSGVDDASLMQQMNTTASFSWRVDDGAGGFNPSATTSNSSTFTIASVDDPAAVSYRATAPTCFNQNSPIGANPVAALSDPDNPTTAYSICVVSIGTGTSVIFSGTTSTVGTTVTITPSLRNGVSVLGANSCIPANALGSLTLTSSANSTGHTVVWRLMKAGVQVGANQGMSFNPC